MNTCREVSSLLEPYTDGELLPERVVEVEQRRRKLSAHCAERVKLDRSIRMSVRKVVYEAAPPSTVFLSRLAAAMEAERQREVEAQEEREAEPARGRALSWRSIAPIAAAAAMVSVWAASTRHDQARTASQSTGPQLAAAAAVDPVNIDQVLDDLVDYHLNPERPVVTEPAQLEQLDRGRRASAPAEPRRVRRALGRRERHPDQLRAPGASRRRGRERADSRPASGAPSLPRGGHRMTLYVYDAAKMPIERRLQARVVRNEPVYVGYKRGVCSIAATERRGVGYAVATDLDDHESAEIVASLTTEAPSRTAA